MLISMAAGLEDLGGTQVLSEEEDDPFINPQIENKNCSHFFDFELPLDSDKSL